MKVGRNQPCPCGSGKKYKNCCLGKYDGPLDITVAQVMNAYVQLTTRMVDCFEKHFQGDCLELAMREFFFWPDEPPDQETFDHFAPLFTPWLLYSWLLDPDEALEKGFEASGPTDATVADVFQNEMGERGLSQIERDLLKAGMETPMSIWEVQGVAGKREVALKDVFTLGELSVSDRELAKALEPGDMIYALVLTVAGRSIPVGVGPAILPPSYKPEIISFRELLVGNGSGVDPEVLLDVEFELRELYFDLFERLSKPPTLVNHDGDRVVPHTIRYQVDDPEYVLERLHSLSVNESHGDILARATKNRQGSVRQVTFDWSREEHDHPQGWTNTVLGKIAIDGKRMVVEVNSAERAAKIQAEVEERLGAHAVHKGTSLQSLESLAKAMELQGTPAGSQNQPVDLNTVPEARQVLVDMMTTHWHNWVDMEIPALRGNTPRAAVATASGREAVAALLLDAERHARRDPQLGKDMLQVIAETRRSLGLA